MNRRQTFERVNLLSFAKQNILLLPSLKNLHGDGRRTNKEFFPNIQFR